MSKLYFRYGAMNSSKSLNLLATAHNYESQGKKVLLLKPTSDTRSSVGKIESRTGLSADCIDIERNTDVESLFLILMKQIGFYEYNCILVDEAQFLTKHQVKQLAQIVDKICIPTICFGLKNSFIDGELFEGSQALLYYSEQIEEIKTICACKDCNKKAIMNLRVVDSKPVYDGEMINCGDTKPTSDYYIPVCRKHYYNPVL